MIKLNIKIHDIQYDALMEKFMRGIIADALRELPREHQALLELVTREAFGRLPQRTKDEIMAAAVSQYQSNIKAAVKNYGVEIDDLHVSLENKFVIIEGLAQIDYDKISELIVEGKSPQMLELKNKLFRILKEKNRDAVLAGLLSQKDLVVMFWKRLFNPYILKIDSIEAQAQ